MSEKIFFCTDPNELPGLLAAEWAEYDARIAALEAERDALPGMADWVRAKLTGEPMYRMLPEAHVTWLKRALPRSDSVRVVEWGDGDALNRIHVVEWNGASWAVATDRKRLHAIRLYGDSPTGIYHHWGEWLFGREDFSRLTKDIQQAIARMDGLLAYPLPPPTYGQWTDSQCRLAPPAGWHIEDGRLAAGAPGDGPAWVGQRNNVDDALSLDATPLFHSLGRGEEWPDDQMQLHLIYGDAFAILMSVGELAPRSIAWDAPAT